MIDVVEDNLPAAVELLSSSSAVLCIFLGGPSPALHDEYSLPNRLEDAQRTAQRNITILIMLISHLLVVGDGLSSFSRSDLLDCEHSAKRLRA